MRKVLMFITVMVFFLAATDVFAGVRSIVDSPIHTQRSPIKSTYVPSYQTCTNMGYTLNSCASKEEGVDYCPTNARYFRYCCPQGYTHKAKQCIDMGLKPSGKSCHGYHRCE